MKILVLGYFGEITKKLDGQTIKTQNIYSLIKENHNGIVDYFDTESFKYSKKSIFILFKKLFQCNILIYLPAHGNLKILFPIFFIFSILFNYKIIYIVIGGWLTSLLKNLPIHRSFLRKIKAICVETKSMQNDLTIEYKFKNVIVLPNFRNIKISNDQVNSKNDYLKIVFMARIQKKKGLDYIFNLANYIKENKLNRIIIDFYGQIDSCDSDYFQQNIQKFDFISYNGSLLPTKIHQVLSEYDILLLPTHYFTEGFPGSVLDAYYAGIPVIVTNWKYANEFVVNEKSGFIIPFVNGEEELIRVVKKIYNQPMLLERMKNEAKIKGIEYSPQSIWNILSNKIYN